MLKPLFNQYLEAHNYAHKKPQKLYAPIDYILGLGGKRIRPIATLIACQLFSEDIEAALPAAYAIEIFHNFSLVHDDIMDKSPLRRGAATVHQKWDTNTAILSGDVMLVYAYEHLSQINPSLLAETLQIFNQIAIGVCEGQQMDMDFEERTADTVTIPEYIEMISLKTSVLVYGAMKIGALIGGASAANAELVGQFGKNLGIAFQLQDDYLDTFGQTAKVGKRIGGDILQNKKTYLIIKALQLADHANKKILENWLSTNVTADKETQKIKEVTAILEQLGIPHQMQTAIQTYNNLALDAWNKIDLPKDKKQPLLDLLHQLMKREY